MYHLTEYRIGLHYKALWFKAVTGVSTVCDESNIYRLKGLGGETQIITSVL